MIPEGTKFYLLINSNNNRQPTINDHDISDVMLFFGRDSKAYAKISEEGKNRYLNEYLLHQ